MKVAANLQGFSFFFFPTVPFEVISYQKTNVLTGSPKAKTFFIKVSRLTPELTLEWYTFTVYLIFTGTRGVTRL